MKLPKSRLPLLATAGAIVGTAVWSTPQAHAQSATSMDVFYKAMQIFQFVSQNAYRLDTPDGKAAPCRDPWVSSAFRLVFQREPSGSGDSGECNYRNFGGGQWSSYRDLVWKTAWYRAYKDLGLVRGGTGLDETLATPEGLQPIVNVAVADVTRGHKPSDGAVATSAGYNAIRARVAEVYYACSDDDISRAIFQTLGRAPRGSENQGECNPLLYGKGKWENYSDLQSKVRKTLVSNPYKIGQCRDGELTRAITEIKKLKNDPNPSPSGMGELGECNMYLYGYGQWSSYNDLKAKVASTLSNLAVSKIQLQPDNTIKTQMTERGGGQGALMAVLAAANAYMQWKAMQPPKQPKNKNQNMMMQGGMQPGMQGGMMQPGMDPNMMGGQMGGMQQPGMMQPGMQGGMMQPGMQQPGMMQPGMMPQMQPAMGMIQPGAQMPMMPPMQQMPMQPMPMQQMPMQGGMMQPGMMQPQQPMMQPGMMPMMPGGM